MNGLHYDLVDLRLFANIADARNLTRGAERSHLSVSAASMRIKNLEEALNTQLFIRQSQGVELTPAGKVALARVLRLLQELQILHGELQEYSRGLKGTVRIFANTTAITEILPSTLASFLASNPHVDVDLEERLSPDIARSVIDGTVHIGILAGEVNTEGLEVMTYRKDRLVLAVSRNHALAKSKEVRFSEVIGFDFVSLHRESAIHKFMDRRAMEVGAALNVRIRVSGFTAVCRMVETDVGIGILPASVAKRLATSHDIVIVPISDKWAVRDLRICVQSLAGLPTFARELVEFLITNRENES